MVTPFARLPPAQQAGILSNDARFATFVATVHGFPGDPANFVRGWCDVASRRELNTNPRARARFETLRTEFDAHTGKLAAPR